MALTLTTAPEAPLLSLAEARAHCRVDAWEGSPPTHEDDDELTAYVAAATGELDGRDGWLGRALITQSWSLTLDRFPEGRTIALPLPPLQEVASIVYVDGDGIEQTLASSVYRTVTAAEPGYVELKYQQSWPASRVQKAAVTLSFTAGYGGAAADVPELIRTYVRWRVAQFYDMRAAGMVLPGALPAEPPHYRNALESLRFRGNNLGD